MLKSDKTKLIAAVILTGALSAPALGQGLTFQEEKADCQDDAMRLCGPYIPDQDKIRTCLIYYKASLSPACRAIVAPQKRGGR